MGLRQARNDGDGGSLGFGNVVDRSRLSDKREDARLDDSLVHSYDCVLVPDSRNAKHEAYIHLTQIQALVTHASPQRGGSIGPQALDVLGDSANASVVAVDNPCKNLVDESKALWVLVVLR